MQYISIIENNDVCFKDDNINLITDVDIPVSDEIYVMFFEQQSYGKQFKIKNIQGTTFEEIFEEYQPENDGIQQTSEIDELKQRIEELEALIKSIKTVDNALLLDTGVVGSVQSTEND